MNFCLKGKFEQVCEGVHHAHTYEQKTNHGAVTVFMFISLHAVDTSQHILKLLM